MGQGFWGLISKNSSKMHNTGFLIQQQLEPSEQ